MMQGLDVIRRAVLVWGAIGLGFAVLVVLLIVFLAGRRRP